MSNELSEVIKMKNKYIFDETFFQEIDTEEKAYILGFVYADGNISNTENDKHYRIRILLKKSDSDILEKIKTAIKYTGPIHYRKRKYKNNNLPEYEIAELSINSKILHTQLMNIGLQPNKTFKIKYPDIPSHLNKHFIRGFFDGDGSIYLRKNRPNGFRVNVTCASKDFIQSLSKIILDETQIATCNICITKNMYRIDKDKNDGMKILNYLYKDATIFLERKYHQYINLKAKMSLEAETPQVE